MNHRPTQLAAMAMAPWTALCGAAENLADPIAAFGPPLRDKTLVVWTAPADLDQRGGSALTIEDGRNHFDAVVFGELAPARWMAGSDTWRRSLREQENIPAETTPPDRLVQVAIVYEGQQVTVFRDGQPYSRHTFAGEPKTFGPESIVGIGRRHRSQSDDARYAGIIEDARIYSRALGTDQLAALRPDESSGPEPWAWWTFDDPEAGDRTGRFPHSTLSGGAAVRDGRLVLDGKTGEFRAETGIEVPFTFETPARPANPPDDWLAYHLAHPGPGTARPGDPNCAIFWKGRYHLHYIYQHQDGYSFAHVSSTDMVRWKWHPTTLTPPETGHGMFSGTAFITREGRPAIIYHGQGSGRNQVAVALDDQLEKWSEPVPVEPDVAPDQDGSLIAHWDPDAWLEGDRYYALSGGSPGSGKPPTLFRSNDLKDWTYLGRFLTRDMPDVRPDEDISCPNFFRIGDRHMLLCISHNLGCRYYLGDWRDERFTPTFHARMNWHGWDFFAPESVLTPDGRRVMWAWCHLGHPQSGIQSLPRELSLTADGALRIRPLRELESLRETETRIENVPITAATPRLLAGIAGDVLELEVRFRADPAGPVGVRVFCNEQGGGGFPVVVDPEAGTLRLGDISAPFRLRAGEEPVLRVFLDKNMIEVFANDRQAVVASHRGPAGHEAIALIASGTDTEAESVTAWKMGSIYQD